MKPVMINDRVKLNENGRIVIPAAMREALQIKAGDELLLRVEDGELRVTTRCSGSGRRRNSCDVMFQRVYRSRTN